MARDYAPRNRAPRGGRKKSGSRSGWPMLLLGLSMGLAVAAFAYLRRPPLIVREAPPPTPAVATREEGGKVPIPPREKQRFTFYELLPGQEVVIPAEPVQAATKPADKPQQPATDKPTDKPADGSNAGTYLIQVGSFRSAGEAEEQKAQLAMLGVEARVEKVTIDNKSTYYRVRVGPFRDAARAGETQAQLEANGLPGLLVKLK